MDLYNDDFLKLLKSFADFKVKYIVVGGFSTNFHGFKRATGDIDFWIKDDLVNRNKLIDALDSIGYGRLDALKTAEFLPGYCEIILDNGIYADLMSHINGYSANDFDFCYDSSVLVNVKEIPIRFLHFNHHIYSKSQSKRAKDQLDVQELNRIKELAEEE